jgi:transposase
MENASAAFLDAVCKSMAAIRIAVGIPTIDPGRLTCAERLQYEGYRRRAATAEAILTLSRQGMPIRQIVRTTGHSRKLVRNVLRALTGDVFRARQSSLEAHLPQLDAEWAAGCRNGAELWRRLRAGGFTGSLRVVGEWTTRRRRSEQAPEGMPGKVPSSRLLARLMTTGRNSLTKAEAVTVTTVEAAVPALDEARSLLSGFQVMIRERWPDLDTWIEMAARSLLASFGNGLSRDRAAVAAALAEPWSNGQTEGQITRLKLVKRQMFGRAKLDLLEARLVGLR